MMTVTTNPIWRTAAILKIVFWLSPPVIVRLTRYLVRTSRTTLRHTPRDENSNFQKFKMRMAAILKIVSSLYLSRGSSDFNEIWCATADFGSKDGQVTMYEIFCKFKMSNGRHIENRVLAISQRFIVRLTRNLI